MRQFSLTALNAMNALDGAGETFLWLATLSHQNMETINIVNDNSDIVSNLISYTAYSFSVVLNDDDGDKVPQLKFNIDNVDRILIDEIRSLPSPMTVGLKLILASDPDSVEMEFPEMTLRRVNYNALTVSGTLVISELLSIRFPKDRITAVNYAGLF